MTRPALLAQLCLACSAAPTPAAPAPGTPGPRPQPTAKIERTPAVPYEPDYLGAAQPSAAVYGAAGTDVPVVVPLRLGYRENAYHLIAFFDGHPRFEAVECMPQAGTNEQGAPRVFAIATAHTNEQEYYINYDDPEFARGTLVPVRRSELRCEVDPDWVHARLAMVLANGERVELAHTGYSAPEARWGTVADPGGHNPRGGLVVMNALAAGIATTGSALTIGGRPFPLVPHEASTPPHFVGFHGYLSRDFRFAFINAHRERELDLTPATGTEPKVVPSVPWQTPELRATTAGVHELKAILVRPMGAPYHERYARLSFNPPFPNLLLMQPFTNLQLRFALSLSYRKEPVVYGDVLVNRSEEGAEVRLFPRFPGWAARDRRMLCRVAFGDGVGRTECSGLAPAE